MMAKKTNNNSDSNSAGAKKWALAGGLGVLAVILVVYFLFFRSAASDVSDKSEQGPTVQEATRQLTDRLRGLISDDKFAAAGQEVEKFLKRYPDAPEAPRLWAMKVVCHRKGSDPGVALRTVAEMANALGGRGVDLCAAGDVLMARECLQDAAKVFGLASHDADKTVMAQANYRAASCYYRLGRYAKAMEHIDTVAALRPDDPKVAEAVKRIEDARFAADR